MKMEQIVLKDILQLIGDNFLDTSEANGDKSIQSIGQYAEDIDSILYISILVDIEEKYQIELPDEFMVKNIFLDVKELVDYICINTNIVA